MGRAAAVIGCPDCAKLTGGNCGKHPVAPVWDVAASHMRVKLGLEDQAHLDRIEQKLDRVLEAVAVRIQGGFLRATLHADDAQRLDRIEAALGRLESRQTKPPGWVATINAHGDRCPSCGQRFIFGMPGPIYRTCSCKIVTAMPLYTEDSGA